MGYDIVVCIKQVPDTENLTGEAMKEDGTVNRAALPAVACLTRLPCDAASCRVAAATSQSLQCGDSWDRRLHRDNR